MTIKGRRLRDWLAAIESGSKLKKSPIVRAQLVVIDWLLLLLMLILVLLLIRF